MCIRDREKGEDEFYKSAKSDWEYFKGVLSSFDLEESWRAKNKKFKEEDLLPQNIHLEKDPQKRTENIVPYFIRKHNLGRLSSLEHIQFLIKSLKREWRNKLMAERRLSLKRKKERKG